MAQMESMILPPRLPLVVVTGNRSSTFDKDARLINCYLETNEQGEIWIRKRPGLVEAQTTVVAAGRGAYLWQGDTYTIFDGTLFRNSVSVSSGLDQAGGVYHFNSILGATPKLVFGNGKKTYAYTVAGGITADLHTIDEDFPAETVKGIVYLNGATYVMQKGGQIWGSVVNSVDQPGDWSALNFIAAQIEPDDGVFLAKQLVYVIALGHWSTEVFYDAGAPEGSPLGNVQGSKISYGCKSADSVQEIDDRLFWISSTRSAGIQVSMLDQLNHQVISTKPIDRILQSSDLSTVYSLRLKISGHSFYILTLKDVNITLAYDISEGMWYQWSDANGNYFPYVAYTYTSDGKHVFQHEGSGKTFYVDAEVYTDAGSKIIADIYTPLFDANTTRRKHLNIMKFVGDQERGSVLFVRCSDDDYRTWSNFRQVSLSTSSPMLVNCGTFTRRAYHLRHWSNTPLRLQAIDVQYDLGTL